MSSIKVTNFDNTSYSIATGNLVMENPLYSPVGTSFEINGVTNTIPMYDIPDTIGVQGNWPTNIEYGYRIVALSPSSFGYPDLGGPSADWQDYLNLDGSASIGRMNKTLSMSENVQVDFSLIYAWNENASSLSADDKEALETSLAEAGAVASKEADQSTAECTETVTGGNSYTWPDGHVCDSAACCTSYSAIYAEKVLRDGLLSVYSSYGITIEGTTRKHIYKFQLPAESEEEGGE